MRETIKKSQLLRAQQLLKLHLQRMPIGSSVVELASMAHNGAHDIDVYLTGMWVGVVEVEWHDGTLAEIRETGHIEVLTSRLKHLKDQFHRAGRNGYWSKDVCLGWLTSDNALLLMNIREIISHWAELGDTNYGKVVPIDQMVILDSTSLGEA
jgi:hypothetical protein